MSYITCSKCGYKNDSESKFCSSCGNTLIVNQCPACHETIDNDWEFCRYCGEPLTPPSHLHPEEKHHIPEKPKKSKSHANSRKQHPKKTKEKTASSGIKKLLKGILVSILIIFVLFVAFVVWLLSTPATNDQMTTPNIISNSTGYALTPMGNSIIQTDQGYIVNNQVVFMLTESDQDYAATLAEELGGRITGYLDYIDLYQVSLPSDSAEEVQLAIESLSKKDMVESAFANVPVQMSNEKGQPCSEQNALKDPIYEKSDIAKSYEMIGMQNMWDLVNRSKVPLNPVHLGIADQGINKDAHELSGLDLSGDLYSGYIHYRRDLGDKIERRTYEHQSHGTEVLQLIAANSTDGGITGAASILSNHLKITSKNVLNARFTMINKDKDAKQLSISSDDEITPSWNGQSKEEEEKEFNNTDERWKKIIEQEGEQLSDEDRAKKLALQAEVKQLSEQIANIEGQLKYKEEETDYGTMLTLLPGQEELDNTLSNLTDIRSEKLSQIEKLNETPTMVSSLVQLNRLVQSGATVINASYGNNSEGSHPLAVAAYRKYLAKLAKDNPHVIFITAAGNNEYDLKEKDDFWSGQLDNVVNVSSVNADGSKSSFTNHSSVDGLVNISAPGTLPTKVVDNKDVAISNGTSYSAPLVTSTVCVMKSINPKLTAKEIKDILIKTASTSAGEKSYDKKLGSGVLQMDKAVLEVINNQRTKAGKEPLQLDVFLDQSVLELTARKSGQTYTVEASVNSSQEASVDLEMVIEGDASISNSDARKTISTPGTATWTISAQSRLKVKVTRLDTGYCSYIELTPTDWSGTWTGGFVDRGDMLPLGFVVNETETGSYNVDASLWPEYIFGDVSHTIEGVDKNLVLDYQWMKDFITDLLDPEFKNFQMIDNSISFEIHINTADFSQSGKAMILFNGTLGDNDIISGTYNNAMTSDSGEWHMKKGLDGIVILHGDASDIRGFWQIE